jgi:hypothetical protein
MQETTFNEDTIFMTTESPFIDDIPKIPEIPNKNVNYTFYFEVNQLNYLSICNKYEYFVNFNGYQWDNLWQSNPYCNMCKNEGTYNYPITDTTKTYQKIPIGEGGFDYPENTFFLFNEIKGYDNVKISCSTFNESTGCLPYTSSNLCFSKDSENFFEETTSPEMTVQEIVNKDNLVYTQNVNCVGEDCFTFFPPQEITFQNSLLYNTQKNVKNIVNCNTDDLQFSAGFPSCYNEVGNPNKICYTGSPFFTYNLYKPLNYSKLPLLNSKKDYVPPTTPIKGGFYNVYPFVTRLKTVQSYLQNGNTLPKDTYSVYEVTYSFNSIEFANQENKIKDFMNLQSYLDSTFTSWFKTTTLYQTSQKSMKKMISDFCYYTSNNTSSLCVPSEVTTSIETFQFKSSFIENNKYLILIIFLVLVILIILRK